MKQTIKQILVLALALVASLSMVRAEVGLADIFGSNMVLQRESNVRIWGKSDTAKSNIKVTTSWDKKAYSTVADSEGRWEVEVVTPEAGGPYTVVVEEKKGERVVLDNVLIGEVWICSGQSNMEMPMKGFPFQPTEGSTEVIMTAGESTPIRMCTVTRQAVAEPTEECELTWQTNNPDAVAATSATAYFFAKRLQEVLDIPVGIVVTCWGGTRVEAWMNREALEGFEGIKYELLNTISTAKRPHDAPTSLYNGMINPIKGFAARGFLWYQGEANRRQPVQYRELMKSFVAMLRKDWNATAEQMPFYYVQIAPYNYDGADLADSAFLREAQLYGLKDIPNCNMAVTLDVGDATCIHPAKKQQVGDRLAWLALHDTFGYKAVDATTPTVKSTKVEGKTIRLFFNSDKLGINPLTPQLAGFYVAGADKVFYPAKAKIFRNGRYVEVSAPEVESPVAVRYAFKNVPEWSLYNAAGMPVSSFRTDDWTDATYKD